ncbi:MAG: carboxypeptidase regulatory-like domain-containing protein [Deltaproteobacteria bacterium]|nr:carboxypeptidase regulatory-like domain-containing protein [Deltaproteobacteria bacterium]
MEFRGYFQINGEAAQLNDEIGVFTSAGVLVGQTTVTSPGYYGSPVTLHVYGDDGLGNGTGAQIGETLTFKAWDSSRGVEIIVSPQDMWSMEEGIFRETPIPVVYTGHYKYNLDIAAHEPGVDRLVPIKVYPRGDRTPPDPYGVEFLVRYPFVATGGSGQYTWTIDPPNAGAMYQDGTLVAGPTSQAITITATDRRWPEAGSGSFVVHVVPKLRIEGPAALHTSETAAYTATGGSGSFTWTTDSGSIDANTGVVTPSKVDPGQAPVYQNIYSHDTVYQNLSADFRLMVFGDVAVDGDPENVRVPSWSVSPSFTARGGTEIYTWTISGPQGFTDQRNTREFDFWAPTAGAFAGGYTITLTDNHSTHTFMAYVPLQVQAMETDSLNNPVYDENGYPVASAPFLENGETRPLVAWGADENLVISVVQKPVAAGDDVVSAPSSSPPQVFDVTASSPGGAEITVREASDTEGLWAGKLRLEVYDPGSVSGAVSNIPAAAGAGELTVTLLNRVTGKEDNADPVSGSYSFNGLSPGYYDLSLRANIPGLVPYAAKTQVMVSGNQVTYDFALPALASASSALPLTVTVASSAPGFTPYQWCILNSKGLLLEEGTETGYTFVRGLGSGTYQVRLRAAGFVPWDSDPVALTAGGASVTATLTPCEQANADDRYVADRDSVTVSHVYRPGGMVLYVVRHNVAHADFVMGIVDSADQRRDLVHGVDYTGSGTVDDPYVYQWSPNDATDPYTRWEKKLNGDETYGLTFFFDNDEIMPIFQTYEVEYTEYAGSVTKKQGKPVDLKNLEEVVKSHAGQDRGGARMRFYPVDGAVFTAWAPDNTGAIRPVAAIIPPLDTDLLFVDDYNVPSKIAGLNNLYYNSSDYYNIPAAKSARGDKFKTVGPDDLLEAEMHFYSLGPDDTGTGISLDLWRVIDGFRVRYNPILGENLGRTQMEPDRISLPLLLNPMSEVFNSRTRLSQAQNDVGVLVSELGDGVTEFKLRYMPVVILDSGYMEIRSHHLTTFGALPADTTQEGPTDSDSHGMADLTECFVGSAAR